MKPSRLALVVFLGATLSALGGTAGQFGGVGSFDGDPAGRRSAPAGPFEAFDLKLVPYFAWANRGRSALSVWLPVVWREGAPR